jgi:arginyl-tRNA synthetase
MVFKSEESIAFTGNTGPYLQYMGSRVSSVLRKFSERKSEFEDGHFDPSLIERGDEWELVKLLAAFPETVVRAAQELSPAVMTGYLYELSQTFSRYYHDNPVLHNENHNLVVTRVTLLRCVLQVLENAFHLVEVPFLEKM